MNETITIPGYGNLEYENQDLDIIFRRTSCFYGVSGTGKTTLLKYYMKKLLPYIPNVLVICPTNSANKAWDGYIPQRCIIEKPTTKLLEFILGRQKDATEVYNQANDIKSLNLLFNRVREVRALSIVKRILRATKLALQKINHMRLTPIQHEKEEKKIKKEKETRLRRIFKLTIKKHRKSLQSQSHLLSEPEKYSLRYLDFNPSLLLILDDCASEISRWKKNKSVSELFFLARHYWITSWYSLQDDKCLPTEIRKNTFVNIFTDPNCAIAFFSNPSNHFNTELKKKAKAIAAYLYRNRADGKKNFKKMIYNREDIFHKFRWIIAKEYPVFKMGCSSLWNLCDKMPKDPKCGVISKSSLFHSSFTI